MLARQLFGSDLVTWAPGYERYPVPSVASRADRPAPSVGRLRQLTCSGTSALYLVLRALGLKAGDEALLPAYHCGKEVAPFRHLGIRPVFYRIGDDLSPQIRHIESLVTSKTKAILVTHFFGFAAPLDTVSLICRSRSIRLIEDCAHALFGRGANGPLGAAGDAAIFSPRKFLPVPDGGIAILNAPDLAFADNPKPPSAFLTEARLLRLWHKSLKRNGPRDQRLRRGVLFAAALPLVWTASGLTKVVAAVTRQWDSEVRPLNPPARALSQGMSPCAQKYIEQLVDPQAIVRARRRNYVRLLAAARSTDGVAPLFDALPDGVNPLCFAVRCPAPRQAARRLRRRGVVAADWWPHMDSGINWSDFPQERRLKSGVLVLPVHQSLSDGAVNRIIDSFPALRKRC